MIAPGRIVGRVAELWRYPVQSMRGERLDSVELTAAGVLGDRVWGIVDPALGQVVSSAQGKRKWRSLVAFGARTLEDGGLEIALPDGGGVLRGDAPDLDARLSAALGQPTHLAHKSRQGLAPPYGHEPIHLLTTATLKELTRLGPQARFMSERFRPNLVLDLGAAIGFVEQGWIGRQLAIGEAVLTLSEDCKRCVMTTLAQGDLPQDPLVLAIVNEHNRAHAGVYARVTRPGRLRRGDLGRLLD